MPATVLILESTFSFLTGLLVWLLVWVFGLGFLAGAIGTAIKGPHPGALLAVPGALLGLIAYGVHAIVLIRRRRKKSSSPSLQQVTSSEFASRVLKVNHAGENGAVNIYAGQIFFARFTAPDMVEELAEFKSHEERHRAIFWAELQFRSRLRCRSYWLCGIGGFMLGLFTGFFGRRAIAATTVAVERVVLRHLEQQLEQLQGKDEAAVKAIASIVAEERQHHDQSASHIAVGQLWPRLLSPIVSASTEAVIWVGMRS